MITSYGMAIYRKVSIFIKVYQLAENFEVCKKSITKITLRIDHILVVILKKKKILSSLLKHCWRVLGISYKILWTTTLQAVDM